MTTANPEVSLEGRNAARRSISAHLFFKNPSPQFPAGFFIVAQASSLCGAAVRRRDPGSARGPRALSGGLSGQQIKDAQPAISGRFRAPMDAFPGVLGGATQNCTRAACATHLRGEHPAKAPVWTRHGGNTPSKAPIWRRHGREHPAKAPFSAHHGRDGAKMLLFLRVTPVGSPKRLLFGAVTAVALANSSPFWHVTTVNRQKMRKNRQLLCSAATFSLKTTNQPATSNQ
jgi:hypothetical protein